MLRRDARRGPRCLLVTALASTDRTERTFVKALYLCILPLQMVEVRNVSYEVRPLTLLFPPPPSCSPSQNGWESDTTSIIAEPMPEVAPNRQYPGKHPYERRNARVYRERWPGDAVGDSETLCVLCRLTQCLELACPLTHPPPPSVHAFLSQAAARGPSRARASRTSGRAG